MFYPFALANYIIRVMGVKFGIGVKFIRISVQQLIQNWSMISKLSLIARHRMTVIKVNFGTTIEGKCFNYCKFRIEWKDIGKCSTYV